MSYTEQSWKQHPTKQQLYDLLPPITKIIQIRQTRHARHRWRSQNELTSDVLLWTSSHGLASVGWLTRTYIHQLCTDTGCCLKAPEGVDDWDEWWESVREIRVISATWWWWWWYITSKKLCIQLLEWNVLLRKLIFFYTKMKDKIIIRSSL